MVTTFLPLRTHFIVNPRSGAALQALDTVRAFAAANGGTVTLTERPRHASELARAAVAGEAGIVAAVGGDGTLNEVASVLVGTPAIFGLVPCGSGNGLGRHLGIHGSVPRALEVLRSGRIRAIDTGLADGHPFFTAAGLGFEAEISERFNQLVKRGFWRYLTTGARRYRNYRPLTYTIEHEGTRTPLPAFTLAVANTDQYGNNAYIAPGATVDDGLLDLTVVPPIRPLHALPLFVRLFRGTLERDKAVWRRRGARFIVERAGPGLIHTDGELHHAPARVEFSVRPASLRIMVPA